MGKKFQTVIPGTQETVLVVNKQLGLRAGINLMESNTGEDISGITGILKKHGVAMAPMFGKPEDRLEVESLAAGFSMQQLPCLSQFYSLQVDENKRESVHSELKKLSYVEAVYDKPPFGMPFYPAATLPNVGPYLTQTPDFTNRQGYLNPAPQGIDARYAWQTQATGAGVQVIDIEGGWCLNHEDLLTNQGGLVAGNLYNDQGARNHGTSVLGIISGDSNSFGITGICPDANIRAISPYGMGSAQAIYTAASMLRPGDFILIEMHQPGPRYQFQPRQDQLGYIAMEWWPDNFLAMAYASNRGIIVIEAAGNGAENLDDPLYDHNPGFPSYWRNSFRRENGVDCGAILVGAGAPPPGTNGQNYGPANSRLSFSNWGSSVDAQGWGYEVTSSGGYGPYQGDLIGGNSEQYWYTSKFGGTSSASPIVLGSLACVQSALIRAKKPILTPFAVRQLLRNSGTPQSSNTGERIGSLPNIKEMLSMVLTQSGVPAQARA